MVSDTSEDVFSSADNGTTSGMGTGSDRECSEGWCMVYIFMYIHTHCVTLNYAHICMLFINKLLVEVLCFCPSRPTCLFKSQNLHNVVTKMLCTL